MDTLFFYMFSRYAYCMSPSDNSLDSFAPSRDDDEKRRSTRKPRKESLGDKSSKPPPAPRVFKPRDGSDLVTSTRAEIQKIVSVHAGKLISMKDWSESGLAKRLSQRFRAAPDIVEIAQETSRRMVALGALDDLRFARGLLRSKLNKSSLSSAVRAASMLGVDKQTCEDALHELREEGLVEEPAEQAYKVWRKKFDRYPLDDKERGKQARFMASRGFSYDALSRVWSRARQGLDD